MPADPHRLAERELEALLEEEYRRRIIVPQAAVLPEEWLAALRAKEPDHAP